MPRYRIQLYNVPDAHLYGWLPARAWRAYWRASWQLRTALVAAGAAAGILIHLVVR